MPSEPTSAPPDRQGNESGHWGLAALLLSGLVILFFPIFIFLFLALLGGAWNIPEVERRHIDYSIVSLQVVVFGILAVSLFALLSGLLGLIASVRRKQPRGLALAGTLLAVLAVAVSVILLGTAYFAIEDAHRLLREHSRFIVAAPELELEVKDQVAKQPALRPMYEKAMKDGVLMESEANAILVNAGTRAYIQRPSPFP